MIDFDALTLRDALDLAILVEQEAKERYDELADQMRLHHNADAASFFQRMRKMESLHEIKLTERRERTFGGAPGKMRREMIFDVEALDYDEARASMTVRHALQAALRGEQKAFQFFEDALGHVYDYEVRTLLTELRDEERTHQGYIEKELAKLPPDAPLDLEAFEDEPVPQ